MENDLLFALIPKQDWKNYSSSGKFEPLELEESGYIRCYTGKQVEDAANANFEGLDDLFLIVIDPLRIHVPIKHEKDGDSKYPHLYGSFSIDAVIDRINLKRGKNGKYSVLVKHFD